MASLREDAVVAMEQDNRNEHDPTAIRIVTEPDGRLAGFIKRTDKRSSQSPARHGNTTLGVCVECV